MQGEKPLPVKVEFRKTVSVHDCAISLPTLGVGWGEWVGRTSLYASWRFYSSERSGREMRKR